ncbi:MAG TPA: mannitol dehydrogenase family protein [Devosiaceae bacterium]|jgi:fructuronate reductase|nr:mannitol dehydrogenase family protein [Devosiaceae bacterium]
MNYERLGARNSDALPREIRRPAYDRAQLRPGILHLGAGAFHRCHQAEWTDDALEAQFGDWGIVAANLRPPDLKLLLGEQQGLFCRELRDSGTRERRLVGAIIDTVSVLDAAYDPHRLSLRRALHTAAAPHIRVITLTVTEKGYCHTPATGELDPDHPDIRHDAANPHAPVSVPGFILRGLALRREAGVAFPTIISCDNVPDNGATLRRCVLGLARMTDPKLADMTEETGFFLNTMVDRIVPATRPEDIEGFAAESGFRDYGLVVGEPFRMWVIEDPHGCELPAWDRAGAMIVDDVVPYELLKMRVLNGIQTNVSALGLIEGHEFMSEVMALERYRACARHTMVHEILPSLPPVPGIDPERYVEQSIERLRNPELRHSTAQIVTDGSQKIRQRLLEPIRACLAAGRPCEGLLMGLAAWMQSATGVDLAGKPHRATDPLHPVTTAIARQAGSDARALVRGLLALGAVFGDDLAGREDLEAALVRYLEDFRTRGVAPVMESAARA